MDGGSAKSYDGEVDVHRQYRDASFTTTGGRGIRVVATLGNRFRRELDDEARANAELIVATMNREAAIIALVQEAAWEIECLRETLAQIASAHHVGNAWAQDKAANALNPQGAS